MAEVKEAAAPTGAPGGPVPPAQFKGNPNVRKFKRLYKQWRIRRRRARQARKRTAGRRSTIILSLIVLLLFGALGYGLNYLSPKSDGSELSLDELTALSVEKRVATSEFRDEDKRIVGTYAAKPVVEVEEEPADEQGNRQDTDAKKGDRAEGSQGDAKNQAAEDKNDKGKGDKGGTDKAEPAEEEESVAPEGAGTFWASVPSSDAAFGPLSALLTENGARVTVDPQTDKQNVRVISTYLLPLLILACVFGLLFTASRGGGGGIGDVLTFGTMGKKKQKRGFAAPVTFNDVAGADEAVAEMKEVVDYLSDPERYEEIGAVPPKGVLLFGPPGCGKTLIAKAVAGEAGVPFFSVAGAEFVESLVGVGAARVRDLFARVRAVAPAIVFIDELDAAGRKRGHGGSSGGSDEREQTLNQLLVEMDGFEVSAGIVVVGATNRPDILDPALLRPGRFDRHITVEQPDATGRRLILELHARGKPVDPSADFDYLAHTTPGFSGADLANVINEAALLTVREGNPSIEMPQMLEAVQRVLHGPKRRGRVMDPEETRRAAYHEGGHAVVSAAVGRKDMVHRVTILARGRGIGLTAIQRDQEALLQTRSQLVAELISSMGGIAAEELILGEPSTGAEQDLEHATELARDMVGRFGMSPRLGRVRLLASDVDQFLGGDSGVSDLSIKTHQELDDEIRGLLAAAEQEAKKLLEANREILDAMAQKLQEVETLEGRALYEALREVETVAPDFNGLFVPVSGNGAAGAGAPASGRRTSGRAPRSS